MPADSLCLLLAEEEYEVVSSGKENKKKSQRVQFSQSHLHHFDFTKHSYVSKISQRFYPKTILNIIQEPCNNTFSYAHSNLQPPEMKNASSFKIISAHHLTWLNVQSSAQLRVHPIYHINYIVYLPAYERSLKHSPSQVNKDFKALQESWRLVSAGSPLTQPQPHTTHSYPNNTQRHTKTITLVLLGSNLTIPAPGGRLSIRRTCWSH